MTSSSPPLGAFVEIEKDALQQIVDRLRTADYRVVGPQVADGAVIYDDLSELSQLPVGKLDVQDGGYYRLVEDENAGYFDHVVGPHSLKNYLFPPRETLLELKRIDDTWDAQMPNPPAKKLAVIGVRSCDLHALAVQDRVFLEGEYVDPAYKQRREGLFVVAVNCRRAAATCFCHSMKTGPAVKTRFDLALTELDAGFVVEIGTEAGGKVIASTSWSPCSSERLERAKAIPAELEQRMHNRSVEGANGNIRQRRLDTSDVHDLLLHNLDHTQWDAVAERCLACANCTLVCPTCFCSSVDEVSDLTGDHVTRERTWASCFTAEHSYMNSGTVRKSTASRYRQWLTHKLASWIDQFGVSGCVGCGRCITWCPVGIDLTEEVAAIRKET